MLAHQPEPSILLVQSIHGLWMLPQEGVLLKERIEDAAWRCLDEEVGLKVDDAAKRRHVATLRDTHYLATIPLPADRHGERPVADNVDDGPLSLIEMRRKAYWLTTLLFRSQADVKAVANRREVVAVEWCTLEDAQHRIASNGRPEKIQVMSMALERASRTFPQVPPAQRWYPDEYIVHQRFCDPAYIVAELEDLRIARKSVALIFVAFRESTVFRPLLRLVHEDTSRNHALQEVLVSGTSFSDVARKSQTTSDLQERLLRALPLKDLELDGHTPVVLGRTEQAAPRPAGEPSLPVARPASVMVLAFSGKEARGEEGVLDRLLSMANATAPVVAHRELEAQTHMREQLALLEQRWQRGLDPTETASARVTIPGEMPAVKTVDPEGDVPDAPEVIDEASDSLDQALGPEQAAVETDGFADMLLELALNVTHSSVGNIYHVNRDGTALELVSNKGSEDEIKTLPLQEDGAPLSVVARVYQRGRAIVINDIRDYSHRDNYISVIRDPALEAYAELAAPIDQGPFASSVPPRSWAPPPRPIGVINVERVRPRDSAFGDYTASDLSALQTIAFLYSLRRAGGLTTAATESLAALTQRTGLVPPGREPATTPDHVQDIPGDLLRAKPNLEVIAQLIYDFTRSMSVTIRVITPDQRSLVRFVAVPVQRMSDAHGTIPLVSRQSVNAWVARKGTPCYIPNLVVKPTARFEGLDGVLEVPHREKPESELCLPISVHGRVVGTLNLESAQRSDYPDDVAAVVSALAAQAGLAVAQARRADEWKLFSVHAAQTRKAHRILRHAGELKEWVAGHPDGMTGEAKEAILQFVAKIQAAADPQVRPATVLDSDASPTQSAHAAIEEAINRSRYPQRVDCRNLDEIKVTVSELTSDVLVITITELLENAMRVVTAVTTLPFEVRMRCSEVNRGGSRYVRVEISNQITEALSTKLEYALYRAPVRRDRVHLGAYMVGSYIRSIGGEIYVVENGPKDHDVVDPDGAPEFFTVAVEVPGQGKLEEDVMS